MATSAFRLLAVVFGIVGGLVELYFAIGFVSSAAISTTKATTIVFLSIVIIIAAAAMFRIQDIALPASIMVLATAIFHNFIEVKLYEFIPVALIGISTLLAFAVDAQSPDRRTT